MKYLKQIKAWFFHFFLNKVSMHDFVSQIKERYLVEGGFLCNIAEELFENGDRVMHGVLLQHFTGADDSCKNSSIGAYYEMHMGVNCFDQMPYEQYVLFTDAIRLNFLNSTLSKPDYWIKLK